jgi:ABC-type bacteriocin/lantibiotic exporter with double-glycine peptidase domain
MAYTQKPGGNLTRRQRENTAFRVVVLGSAMGVAAVITFVLNIAGVLNWHPWVVLTALTVVLAYRFTRITTKR